MSYNESWPFGSTLFMIIHAQSILPNMSGHFPNSDYEIMVCSQTELEISRESVLGKSWRNYQDFDG